VRVIAISGDSYTFQINEGTVTVTPLSSLADIPFQTLYEMDTAMYRAGAGSTATRRRITSVMDRKDPLNDRLARVRGR
jgi:hypothetical protein